MRNSPSHVADADANTPLPPHCFNPASVPPTGPQTSGESFSALVQVEVELSLTLTHRRRVSIVVPIMLDSITWGTYVFFLAFLLLGVAWVIFLLPETRGKVSTESAPALGWWR